jgi:hypothetical protein
VRACVSHRAEPPRDGWALALAVVVVVGACVPDHGNFPGGTSPSSGGTGTPGTTIDAGAGGDGGAGTGRIRGRVCVTADVRAGCATLAGSRLTVRVVETGASATVSTVDGSFDLPGLGASDAGATSATVATNSDDSLYFGGAFTGAALDSAGGAQVEIPVLTRADVETLVATNALALPAGTGILVVHVHSGGTPLPGATLDPFAGVMPDYDAGSAELLSPSPPTGPAGTAVYFGVVGTATYGVHAGAKNGSFGARAIADSVTFTDATL